ncbi:hypothetical protein A3J22_00030 [Candidatus Beckwithbacteria bacterium RIFCSPLOWO2_02_FULL_49_12]|nr:MAG: hypothetical protein A3J22_00030 [Candidatus Beckwithbacteria bacterium RIFCSPLOWO2_02_FULL_49_12]
MKKKRKSLLMKYAGLWVSVGLMGVLGLGSLVLAKSDGRVLGLRSIFLADKGSSSGSSESTESSGSSSSDDSKSGTGGSTTTVVGTTVRPAATVTVKVPRPVAVEVEEVEDETEVEDDEEEVDDVQRTINRLREEEARTEVRFDEGERIRVRTKDERTRIEVTSGGVKTKLEYRDGRMVVKAEMEDGTEQELEDDAILKISQRLDDRGIKVATAAGEKFVLQHGATGAVTEFPLSIDLATNTLKINTPAGERSVSVLPGQAVTGLLVAQIVSQIGGQRVAELATSGELTGVKQLITLAEREGVSVYEIAGVSNQRLLGLVPVGVQRTAVVSAETGELVMVRESLLNQVIDALAF